MRTDRRAFLQRGVAFSLGFSGLAATFAGGRSFAASLASGPGVGYGPLLPDPNRIFDLPKGFTYTVLSRQGEVMADGTRVPGMHDGMAAFPGADGRVILIRNHEIEPGWLKMSGFGEDNRLVSMVPAGKIYDAGGGRAPSLGGTTTVVYDPQQRRVVTHYLSLAGTNRNCAGGPTPWGSWLTCEEDVQRVGDDGRERDHGYVFEVPASETPLLADPVPIKAMGRFNHEAVAIHPNSGVVYLTEDRGDGLLYRFIPEKPGKLLAGGRLQALMVRDRASLDTRNWESTAVRVGESLPCAWIDVEEIDAPKDDLRLRGFAKGAARFARGEGMWWGNEGVYFACTNGGKKMLGQLWKYVPSPHEGQPAEADAPGALTLFIEPNDSSVVENADNLTVSPWGDLIVCEDGDGDNFLFGVTPRGEVYRLGRNAASESELAGATFSPDGRVLFVNIQRDGMTLAIHGPWREGQLGAEIDPAAPIAR